MRHIPRLAWIVLLMGIFLVSGAACRDDDDPTSEDEDRAILARMEEDIDLFIGDAECLDENDCRALPFGDKPCGGPWGYKVFSVTAVDSVQLAEMIDHYNEFNTLLNVRYNWASDCMYVMEPEVGCVKGSCEAVLKSKIDSP